MKERYYQMGGANQQANCGYFSQNLASGSPKNNFYQILVRGRTTSPTCFRLPFNVYAKVGLNVSEANALRYISRRVVGPVPTGAFIVMTALLGKLVEDCLYRIPP